MLGCKESNADVAATPALPGAQGRHINKSEIDTCILGRTCTQSTVRSNPQLVACRVEARRGGVPRCF
eukprot:6110014-Pyramimonas_sp.AAC.1